MLTISLVCNRLKSAIYKNSYISKSTKQKSTVIHVQINSHYYNRIKLELNLCISYGCTVITEPFKADALSVIWIFGNSHEKWYRGMHLLIQYTVVYIHVPTACNLFYSDVIQSKNMQDCYIYFMCNFIDNISLSDSHKGNSSAENVYHLR